MRPPLGAVLVGDPIKATLVCHCGVQPVWHEANKPGIFWTRGLCEHCDSVRCDAYPGECGR